MSAIDDPTDVRTTSGFTVATDLDGSRATLRPRGEVDIATAPAIEQQARALWNDGAEQLLLDLGDVSFFDSSGLRLLFRLEAEAELDRRRAVALGPCSPAVLRVLALTGLTDRFPSHAPRT
jgi:anti-anti-sigma factor